MSKMPAKVKADFATKGKAKAKKKGAASAKNMPPALRKYHEAKSKKK